MFPLLWFQLTALFALYVSSFASASAEPIAITATPPAPHIALLLPLNSPGLATAANAIRKGILAAASLQNQTLPLRVYGDIDEAHSLAAYKNAVASGAVAVIGPLTRSGIHQLADEKSLPVPTLTLNVIEGLVPPQLYFFGMAVDAEARQVARYAKKQGFKQAIVITTQDALAHRLQVSFEEQWIASGGTVAREIEFNDDTSVLTDLLATPDSMVFFATDVEKTRAIRAYLPNGLAAYATSQLFIGNNDKLVNFDLDGIRFVDMPWLLQADTPAIMAYPRAASALSIEHERLYALGIDAYRLINVLLANQAKTALPLEGVTGRIRLNGQTFQHEALPALFVQGQGQSLDAPITPAVQLFPDQFKKASPLNAASQVATGIAQ